jgi:Flp pilus assembly protein TadB
MDTNEITRGGKAYVGYEYKTVTIDNEKASMYLDAYENFGWISDESTPARQYIGVVTLKLKRNRKIMNKAELTRLQQHFEACIDEIAALEKSKTLTATIISITTGIIGTAFIAGSVFAVTNEPPLILLCVLLGIPGFIGWALPYRLYKRLTIKRTAEIAPLIEQKYDDVHEICEKGNALLH